ncbi:hypothetical protein FHG66_06560 [Rubellimicrobium rubrum]|uniref:Uncharacterized protein n=1 Tax=Rubellimicrobium rubrum TaxID=2585369 RepID=A0A5C4N3U8_9RHOB|nr:hypothetical protein [Rubellimicrobium rubrum]TNC51202.1 hypothetical protein FHG66_06560 [Rubellimicrobium rubrum]
MAFTSLALLLPLTAARAQGNPDTVGVSVDGTVMEVPFDLAVEACGIDAETLRAEWASLGTEVGTMADTSVNADATDLAPEVAVDTPMDSTIDGVSVADGADATHDSSGDPAPDVASDGPSGQGTADEPASDPAVNDGPATPTQGTTQSKAAVCEVGMDTATALGLIAP